MLQCGCFGWTNEIFPLYNGDLLFWVLFCFAFLPDKRLFIFPGSKIQGVLWTRVFYDNCFFAHFQSVNLCKANWSATNKKIFWHFLQFNWIYRVFPRIGDAKIITRSEINYGCSNCFVKILQDSQYCKKALEILSCSRSLARKQGDTHA